MDKKSRNGLSCVEWKRGRCALRGSVHTDGKPSRPWVIFSHGFTGHRMGPGYLFVRLSRALQEIGVSSLRFDFGGAGESDGRFQDMTLTTMREDLAHVIRSVKRRFRPSHIVLLGHSLGGCVAALCAGQKGVDGMVLLAPVAHPMGLAERRKDVIARGPNQNGYYENGPFEVGMNFLAALRNVDPVASVTSGLRGRLLLIQGDADESVSVKESGRYAHAAQRGGVTVDYHVFRGVDHNFSSVSAIRNMASILCAWMKEHYR